MSTQNDGGPAFPQAGSQFTIAQRGMSLRDWFAGMSAQGILANPVLGMNTPTAKIADYSYEIADAMLDARERKEQP